MKIERSIITPKWLEIKEMYEDGTNGSSKYGTNFPINGELDKLSLEFVNNLGVLTEKFGNDSVIEGVRMDLWKERIWCLIENAGLLREIAWKEELEDEVVDTYYDEFDDEDLDQEPTDEELMNLDINFGNE